jgi:hypothetical protein
MGYRSEVVLALDAKVVPALMTIFAKCEETQKLCTQHMSHIDTDYCGKGNWLMVWEGIKWYDSYPEIQMITRLVDALESDDLSEFGLKALDYHDGEEYSSLFSFARIGEESGDEHFAGYGFDSIAIQRSISF